MSQVRQAVEAFARKYLAEQDQFPTTRTIQKAHGWRSQTTAMKHLQRMERDGIIQKNSNGRYRFVRKHSVN